LLSAPPQDDSSKVSSNRPQKPKFNHSKELIKITYQKEGKK
jgi:hypothetical protein